MGKLQQPDELKYLRERFGGGDGRAINKHSVRIYNLEGSVFVLDRTLDAFPKFFMLYVNWGGASRLNEPSPFNPAALMNIIKVHGQEYWGDGLSWQKAVPKAMEAISTSVYGKNDDDNGN